jgi:Tol biopolymer transport system component
VLLTGGRNEGPQFSPDGQKLVFMSNRAGGQDELWIADANGQHLHQLTSGGNAGTPRWSPDGTKIAFDSEINDRAVILVVNAAGGQPALMVGNDSNNRVPSWSHDGKYLYFASDRSGRYEVWKVPAVGGPALQVTGSGGFAAFESPDGKSLYYSKNQFERPEIWAVPVNGGNEELASTVLRPGTWASWGIVGNAIYFVEEGPGNVAVLSRFDLQTQQLRQLTLLGRFPFWLGLRPDGKKAVFDRVDSDTTMSIVELEDFE